MIPWQIQPQSPLVFLGPRPGAMLAAVTLLVHVMSSAGVDLGISQLQRSSSLCHGGLLLICRTRGVSTNAMSLFTLWELLTIASIDLANARPGNLLKILGF